MRYKVISFYKYIQIEDPLALKEAVMEQCKALSLLGRILLGKEGINGAISGNEPNIKIFKEKLLANLLFKDLTFREQSCTENVYHKLVVRIRDEIVVFGKEVNLQKSGKHLTPQELKTLYDQNEYFVIIDARNDYEYDLGKIKWALRLPIKNFREFPQALKKLAHLKQKKVVLYCTGGVRCEKASAFMKENGFQNVQQLEGGIINYLSQFSDDNWQGNCFVFDDRLVSGKEKPITLCESCDTSCSSYTNCHNLDCDRLFIACEICLIKMNKTCSEECKISPRQRKGKYNQVAA